MIVDGLQLTDHARQRLAERRIDAPTYLRRLRPYEVDFVKQQFATNLGLEVAPSFCNRRNIVYATFGEYGRLPLYVLRSDGNRCYTLITAWWVEIPPQDMYDRTVVDKEAIRAYGSAPIYNLQQRGCRWVIKMAHPDGRIVKASGKKRKEALRNVLVKYFKHCKHS